MGNGVHAPSGDHVAGDAPARVAGLLLAAGSGRRYGQPKALVDTGSGPWVLSSLDALSGCDVRYVVVGASAGDVAALLPPGVHALHNQEHSSGMGSSLRLGLRTLSAAAGDSVHAQDHAEDADELRVRGDVPPCDAVVVHLVDLPGVGPDVVRRLVCAAGSASASRGVLLRAGYFGVPGHPVMLGRDHWAGVIEGATGDTGGLGYFRRHPPALVECGDIGSGEDVDVPPTPGRPVRQQARTVDSDKPDGEAPSNTLPHRASAGPAG